MSPFIQNSVLYELYAVQTAAVNWLTDLAIDFGPTPNHIVGCMSCFFEIPDYPAPIFSRNASCVNVQIFATVQWSTSYLTYK